MLGVAADLGEIGVQLRRLVIGELAVRLPFALDGHHSARTGLLLAGLAGAWGQLRLIVKGPLVLAAEFLEGGGVRCLMVDSLAEPISVELAAETGAHGHARVPTEATASLRRLAKRARANRGTQRYFSNHSAEGLLRWYTSCCVRIVIFISVRCRAV